MSGGRPFTWALLACAGLLVAAVRSEAQLLPDALLTFPAATKSFEYDNLRQLRKLPQYGQLRQQYGGAALQEAVAALRKLGITEDQLGEVVTASGPSNFYGIAAGSFNKAEVRKRALALRSSGESHEGNDTLCPSPTVCVTFSGEFTLLFGSQHQIEGMLAVRSGRAARLNSNTASLLLLEKTDRQAQVIGVAPGSELQTWIGESIPSKWLSQANLGRLLSGITQFSYSVRFDSKAHVVLNLACTSSVSARALHDGLLMLRAMQSVGKSLGSEIASGVDNVTVQTSGNLVALTLDADVAVK